VYKNFQASPKARTRFLQEPANLTFLLAPLAVIAFSLRVIPKPAGRFPSGKLSFRKKLRYKEKNVHIPRQAYSLAVVVLFSVPAPVAAQAQTVSPGGWEFLTTPVQRGTECYHNNQSRDCSLRMFVAPNRPTEATGTLIRATVESEIVDIGLDELDRAIAWLDYEFLVEGDSNSPVDGALVNGVIAVRYDLRTFLGGGAAYAANTLLVMTVSDISDPGESEIASLTLWDSNRQGDQGVTDITLGRERHIFNNNVASLDVTLGRGRHYRVRLAAQGSGTVLALANKVAITQARIDYIRVQIDEDEVELLIDHDNNVLSAIANHDAAIGAQVSQHDADIKALLNDIKDGQEEIIRLLLTPHGRRKSELGSFPLKKRHKK
jgi:hypothetical protein